MFRLDPDQVYRSSLLDNIPWLRHGFGTRLSAEWLAGDPVSTLRQIHSDQILSANGRSGLIGEGDALISCHPGALLSVRTADCLPILIADVRNHAVGVVHAGWRGTVTEIAAKTVSAMQSEFGSRPEDLRAAVGPGIGSCCFEVGPDVASQFGTIFPERDNLRTHTKLDLIEANCRQLVLAGISSHHVDAARLCTRCRRDLFHSFRRDHQAAGRMISAIGIRA